MEGYNNTIETKTADEYKQLMSRLNKRSDVWGINSIQIDGRTFVNYQSSLPEGEKEAR